MIKATIIASLIFALVSAVLFVCSYRGIPHLVCQWHPKRCAFVIAVDGDILFADVLLQALLKPRSWVLGETPKDGARRRLYYGFFRESYASRPGLWQIPVWPFVMIFLGYPVSVLAARSLHRWRRQHKGLCLKCGYNLTGNVTGVCPECGHEI